MDQRSLLSAAAILLSGVLTGQAEYDGYGRGCPGTGKGPSIALSSNLSGGTNAITAQASEFAYGFVNSGNAAITVVGCQFFTNTFTLPKATTRIAFYYADGTPNGTIPAPVRETLGEMEVGSAQAWYTGFFPQPQVLQPGQTCWVSQGNTADIRASGVTTGTPPAVQTFQRQPPFGTSAWSQSTVVVNAAATLLVAGGNGVPNQPPTLTTTGVPSLGNSTFELRMNQGAVGFPVTLLVGVSSTVWGNLALPFDIGRLVGSPGCNVLASAEFTFGAGTTDAAGTVIFPLPVPALGSLRGLSFYNQFYMLDPTANAGQLVVSNAGKGTIN